MACSAVVIELPNGVFITMMPLPVAAGISTLSTPMPARPITLRRAAFSRILAVTLVAERTARPSNSPMISARRALSLPRLGWKSTSTPRSLKIWTAAEESASEMRTRGVIGVALHCIETGRSRRRLRRRGRGRSGRLRHRVLGFGERPVEPLRQGLDVAGIHRRAAPDAQARRGIAVMGEIVAGALLLHGGREALCEGGLGVEWQRGHG